MKSKKIILSIAIVALSMISVQAFSQVKFGLKAEVGLNNPEFSTNAVKVENMTTYSVGPSIEAMFPMAVMDLGVEASLLYNDNRMTVARLTEGNGDRDVSNRYLVLPVNLKAKFGLGNVIGIYGVAGPYAGYLISGDKIDFEQIGSDVGAKSFQAGINLGFGVEILKMVQVGANYRVQLTDNYAVSTPDWRDPLNGKSETWSITASVYF